MIEQSINRLEYLTNTIPPLLLEIEEDSFSLKPSPSKWSKKEIIISNWMGNKLFLFGHVTTNNSLKL